MRNISQICFFFFDRLDRAGDPIITHNTKNTGDKAKERKKEPKWTGKNMWKLGLIFLGGYAVISTGALVYIWGKLYV